VLAGLIGRQVINAGIPGEISAEGAARLPALLDRFRPSLLILCHGANDILRQMDRGQAAANLRTMVRAARDRGVSVVLVGVPEFGLTLSTPSYYGEIAHEYALPFEDGTLAKIERKNDLKSDIIHPNAAGYRMMAEAVAAVLRSSGAI
jgi:lysophospholipase L1-like esterase